MRIAQVAPLYEAVPPRLYGGTERIVAHLTDALVSLGHEVTLFASAEARTLADLVVGRARAIRLDPNPMGSDLASHMVMMDEIRRRQHCFDILHFHVDLIHFPFFADIAERTVTTLHGRLDLQDLAGAYGRWHAYPLVAISAAQRATLPQANWQATIPHGLAAGGFRFTARPRGAYLAFLGRISPEKRPDRAIEIARRCGIPLRIAAKVDRADEAYFREKIEPLLADPLVEYLGEIGDEEKSDFLGNARALLFPIDWPEPFGLVMIEAMACGTPVIAWRRGSVPEVVDDGVSGFLVEDLDEAVAATAKVEALDRRRVRACFEQRFTAEVMAGNYLKLYWRLNRDALAKRVPAARLEQAV